MGHELRALVVEDDVGLSESLQTQLSSWGFSTGRRASVGGALEALQRQPWDLLLLDLGLPGGSGMSVAEALPALGAPPLAVVISGTASVEEGFRLAQIGVNAYLPKPLRVADLRETVRVLFEQSASDTHRLTLMARASVGRVAYQDATDAIRRAMVAQALRMAGGNKAGAARILQVSRQAVQQLVRSFELE